ncbi:MAG: ABC transporter permease [Chloroflexi bacterium]|nr:ABC transporter permease [Chloroflexota bacterium]
MGFLIAVATIPGLIIGILCGLVPLGIGLRYQQLKWGIVGLALCALAGFSFSLIGGFIMLVFTTAVVISYAFVDHEDPFTSRASIEAVNFEESQLEFLMRQMAALGRTIRQSVRALIRNKAGFLGFIGILFFVGISVFGPLFIEYDGDTHVERLQPGARTLFQKPSSEFILGLDWKGRDIFSHMVHGGQNLIITSIEAGLIATLIAVVVGALAAMIGGVVDQVLSAIANFILTIPQFPLLLVLASILSFSNHFYLALLFAGLSWPALMRAVRAQVLSLRERDYVQAAVALDLGLPHIIIREVLPNLMSYIVVNMIFSIRSAMYYIVGLVFLGLVPLEEPDWGVMIYVGRQQGAIFNSDGASMILSPVIAIALFQLSLILFTRSLEEVFNPRLRSGL